MSVQSSLRVCATAGNTRDTIAVICCSAMFNMRNVVVTRKTLWRLCGYGNTSADRYLDDQVSVIVIITLDKIQLVTTGCRLKVPSDILIRLSRDSSLSLPGLEVERIDAFMNLHINKSALYNYADVWLTTYFKKMN